MYEFTIEIAGRRVKGTACHRQVREHCWEYLCTGEPDFAIAITPEDIDRERVFSLREAQIEGRPCPDHSRGSLEVTAVQRKIAERLLEVDILLFHGSAIGVDGECYLFTAKSGTGKSTHTRLWREMLGERAVMVDDDKPFLQIGEGGVSAFGTPWNGKHHLGTNIQMPMKAICILERGTDNRIVPIAAQEALVTIFQQTHRPADVRQMGKYLELVDRLAGCVPFYRLQCNMDPQAARTAYQGMSGKVLTDESKIDLKPAR